MSYHGLGPATSFDNITVEERDWLFNKLTEVKEKEKKEQEEHQAKMKAKSKRR
jgi:hypothetical protein